MNSITQPDNTIEVPLHLPSQASPYVIVLNNVPKLAENQSELYETLKNQVVHWILVTSSFGINMLHQNIIMLRRVNWVGSSGKLCQGDCVVNFRSRELVGNLVEVLSNNPTESGFNHNDYITAVPLGFFYRPRYSNANINPR